MHDPSSLPPRLRRPAALGILFLAGSAGVVLGALRAASEILSNGYLRLGFGRSIRLELEAGLGSGLLIGLAAGLLYLLVRAVLSQTFPRLAAPMSLTFWIALLRRPRLDPWPLLSLLGAGIVLILAASYRYRVLGHFTLSRIILGIVLAGVLYLLARILVRLTRAEAPTRAAALIASLVGTGLIGLLFGVVLNGLYLFDLVDPRTGLAHVLFPIGGAVLLALLYPGIRRIQGNRSSSARPGLLGGVAAPSGLLVMAGLAVHLLPLLSGAIDRAAPGRLNVVLIGVDTFRADRFWYPGGEERDRLLTPNLARLAERGTVFERAISQAPWTMPAFASILTGKYPHEHGAFSMEGYLRSREVTLAEILRESGYRTGAVVSHGYLNSDHGFSQGFDSFNQENDLGHWAITSPAVTDRALEFLDEAGSESFFLFVHYFDPHYEYRDHEDFPYSDAYQGWLRNQPMDIRNILRKRQYLEKEDIRFLEDLYDEEIAFTDRAIGRLLEGIGARGLDESTMIVVVADHGEEFMEHGWIGHTITLLDELIRVPCLVVVPGGNADGPVRIGEVVETRSVYSTILDRLGIDFARATRPPGLFAARSDSARADGQPAGARGRAFSSVWLPDAKLELGLRTRLTSVRTDRWKLIHDFTRNRLFLFDLERDPGETVNRAREEGETLEALFEALQRWGKEVGIERRDAPTHEPSEDVKARLRALGYL